MSEEKLSTKQQLAYAGFGVLIAIAYTVWFVVIMEWVEEGEIDFVLIPEAQAQIQPFELQLEQIRDPQECTRKVVQGRSAEIPFSMKIFYDTTRDTKLEFKQQSTSFPLVQRTNQVMTFYTNGTDQYQIYMEVNYPDRKERQIYIEYLSGNRVVQSEQEKFNTERFCMTIFANTVLPVKIPTKEEIFGESLDYIGQIPSMVIAFNANTITNSTTIAFMWMLILAILVVAILTLISSSLGKKKFDSKIRDLDDSIAQAQSMTLSMDNLSRSVSEPLLEVKNSLKAIMSIPQIRDMLPKKEKQSKFKLPFRKKKGEGKIIHEENIGKKELMSEEEVISLAEQRPKTESDEVLEALQPTEEETQEEIEQEEKQIEKEVEKEQKPSGGFVLSEEKSEPEPPKETNPMRLKPKIFDEILKGIDFKKRAFKEGEFDKFSYTELNQSYGWIVKYRKWMIDEEREIPTETRKKQSIIEKIVYEAIFRKMEKHQIKTQPKDEEETTEEDEKDD